MVLRVDTLCKVEALDEQVSVFRIDVAKNETGVLKEYFSSRILLAEGETDKQVDQVDLVQIERFFLQSDRAIQIKLVPLNGNLADSPAIEIEANQPLYMPAKLGGVYLTSLGGVTHVNVAGFGRNV